MSKFVFSSRALDRLKSIIETYPDSKSAVMPALYIVQEEQGYISEEGILWVAEQVGLAPVHVREVASFYTMFYKKPVGKYHVQICRTLSCMLSGAKELSKVLKERFQITSGEVSSDGMWSFEEVECLGSCGTAPMAQINDRYFENLTPQSLVELIDDIEREKPNLRLSTIDDEMPHDLRNYPMSLLSKKACSEQKQCGACAHKEASVDKPQE